MRYLGLNGGSKSDLESIIFEAIYIKKEMPKLNKNLFNSGSLYTFKVYP